MQQQNSIIGSGIHQISIFNKALTRLSLQPQSQEQLIDSSELLEDLLTQLGQYFTGQRHQLTIPLKPQGTPFQLLVWAQLQKIPYGQTQTYGQIAQAIGKPKAVRAVGQACGANPIIILIPCHRVVASHGKIGGYSGGIEFKQALLSLERKYSHISGADL